MKPPKPLKRVALPPRRTPLKRGGRVRQISDKKRREQPARRATVAEVVARDGNRCSVAHDIPEVACWHPADTPLDPDEIVYRSQRKGAALDPDNVRLACRAHHDWMHHNRIEAAHRGLRTYPAAYMGPRPGEHLPR